MYNSQGGGDASNFRGKGYTVLRAIYFAEFNSKILGRLRISFILTDPDPTEMDLYGHKLFFLFFEVYRDLFKVRKFENQMSLLIFYPIQTKNSRSDPIK